MAEISKETEQHVIEFQQLQGQLQMVIMQRSQLKGQADEVEGALETLKKAQGKVYRSTGLVLVEAAKDELTKELGEKKDTILVRVQVLAKQEEKLRSIVLDSQKKLQERMKEYGKAGPAR